MFALAYVIDKNLARDMAQSLCNRNIARSGSDDNSKLNFTVAFFGTSWQHDIVIRSLITCDGLHENQRLFREGPISGRTDLKSGSKPSESIKPGVTLPSFP